MRYRGIGPTIEEHLIYDRNKNKRYCGNFNAQRISILISYYENPSPLLGIAYEILMDCKNNNMKKCTSQNKTPTTQPSTVALGIRIRGLNFVLKNNCSTFLCFSAIMLFETKISGKSATVKKCWCVIEFNYKFCLYQAQCYQQVICEEPFKQEEPVGMEKLDIKLVSDQLVVNIVVTDIDVELNFNESLNSDGNILSRGATLYGINIKEISKIYV